MQTPCIKHSTCLQTCTVSPSQGILGIVSRRAGCGGGRGGRGGGWGGGGGGGGGGGWDLGLGGKGGLIEENVRSTMDESHPLSLHKGVTWRHVTCMISRSSSLLVHHKRAPPCSLSGLGEGLKQIGRWQCTPNRAVLQSSLNPSSKDLQFRRKPFPFQASTAALASASSRLTF